ncbi:MAG: response regulator transcription factor [Chloroflexi bacterium]|nr:response regulator transcription factor [Chloroflexota bacterium]
MAQEIPIRVMVVEDSIDFLAAILATLSLEPHLEVVSTVISGEEALRTLEEAEPDLVILDYRLPGLNGLETARRIKAERPHVKIALLTAYAEELLSLASLPRLVQEAGIIDLIPKAGFNSGRITELLELVRL